MGVYSIEKLMTETRLLAANYYRTTGLVLPVSNELARFDAARLLGFQEISPKLKGVDLIGVGNWEGLKCQVKARVVFKSEQSTQRIGQLNWSGAWDSILLVLMDADYQPTVVYLSSRETLEANLAHGSKVATNPRGAMSVARFKKVGDCLWSAAIDSL